jgi:hypothetical protein
MTFTKTIGLAAILALGALPGAAAATTVLTFDSHAATGNSPGSPVPLAAQLSADYLASDGVVFSSGGGYAAVVDHVPGCIPCTPTPPNILGGTNANGALDYSAIIRASFFLPANTSLMATTNFVRVLADQYPLGSGTVYLEAYGLLGNLIASTSAPDVGAIGTVIDLNIAANGIHSVRFYSDNATVGFDNFEFGNLAAVVPEPSTWAMLIVGMGCIGAAMRRRRKEIPALA